ncbi:hypothetical protein [Microbacterium rhizomatis]|uniref:Uncharacterized protein n=1 Tax=Microbacterium rhizomatis TaxID=1631477 RepID=A0A5J5J190_9MICO|nr:hypothetical protein [Microbacterium rhizomatis]KAA9108296.1 hypothetical protein F6B43_12945 [Microbacterium rhizomatis]
MNAEDFREAILAERLMRWVQVGPPDGASANRVCVYGSEGFWQSVITDERAGLMERLAADSLASRTRSNQP